MLAVSVFHIPKVWRNACHASNSYFMICIHSPFMFYYNYLKKGMGTSHRRCGFCKAHVSPLCQCYIMGKVPTQPSHSRSNNQPFANTVQCIYNIHILFSEKGEKCPHHTVFGALFILFAHKNCSPYKMYIVQNVLLIIAEMNSEFKFENCSKLDMHRCSNH